MTKEEKLLEDKLFEEELKIQTEMANEKLRQSKLRLEKAKLESAKMEQEIQRLRSKCGFAFNEETENKEPLSEEEAKKKEEERQRALSSLETQRIVAYVVLFFISLGIPLLILIGNAAAGDSIGGMIYGFIAFPICTFIGILIYAGCSWCTADEAKLLAKEGKIDKQKADELKFHAAASTAIGVASIAKTANSYRKIPVEIYNNANKR